MVTNDVEATNCKISEGIYALVKLLKEVDQALNKTASPLHLIENSMYTKDVSHPRIACHNNYPHSDTSTCAAIEYTIETKYERKTENQAIRSILEKKKKKKKNCS